MTLQAETAWHRMAGHTVMLFTSLPIKSKVRLAHDVIDTCTMHAGLVHDITGRDCLTQNGRSHSHVGYLFTNKEQSKVGSWCNTNRHLCYACRPCSWHYRQRLPDTKWQITQSCFHNFQTLIFNKLDHKSTEKIAARLFKKSYFYDRAHKASLGVLLNMQMTENLNRTCTIEWTFTYGRV